MNYTELHDKFCSGESLTDEELLELYYKSEKVAETLSGGGSLFHPMFLLTVHTRDRADAALLERGIDPLQEEPGQ